MGSVKLNAGGQCVRFLFIAWNVLVLCIGVVAIGVGSWQIASDNDYDFLTEERYVTGSALLIVAGIVAVLVAALGAVGAIMLWRIFLALYAIIVFIFVLLEIASAVLGFVYSDQLDDDVSKRATDAITSKYSVNDTKSDANKFIDFMQKEFECCGWNNYKDWLNSTYFNETSGVFPSSCNCSSESNECVNCTDSCVMFDNQYVQRKGCENKVLDVLERYQIAVGIVGIIFAVLQFLAMVVALALCCCVHMANREYTTV